MPRKKTSLQGMGQKFSETIGQEKGWPEARNKNPEKRDRKQSHWGGRIRQLALMEGRETATIKERENMKKRESRKEGRGNSGLGPNIVGGRLFSVSKGLKSWAKPLSKEEKKKMKREKKGGVTESPGTGKGLLGE